MSQPAAPGCDVTDANRITAKEIDSLIAANHAVFVKPKLGVVVVDGHKRYKLPKGYKVKA